MAEARPNWITTVAPKMLGWYAANARVLPWRYPPGGQRADGEPPDPYRVWLAEVMLQQTTVVAVIPYFLRFTERWPDVMALAAADEAEVMAAWAGLGYYARARRLIACARAVAARGGRFPDDEAGLRALPGLGAYTAAAVAAIGFGRRAVVIDANITRVVARLFRITTPLPAARGGIHAAVEAITPRNHAGDFAQAMMDLGATLCTPRAPQCPRCPLGAVCQAYAEGNPEALPVKAAKLARPERQGTAFWLTRGYGAAQAVWLVRRPAHGLLAGMRALPDDGWSARSGGTGAPPFAANWRRLGVVRHGFTHCTLSLTVLAAVLTTADAAPLGEGTWWPFARLTEAGLPTLFAKAAQLALVEGG